MENKNQDDSNGATVCLWLEVSKGNLFCTEIKESPSEKICMRLNTSRKRSSSEQIRQTSVLKGVFGASERKEGHTNQRATSIERGNNARWRGGHARATSSWGWGRGTNAHANIWGVNKCTRCARSIWTCTQSVLSTFHSVSHTRYSYQANRNAKEINKN